MSIFITLEKNSNVDELFEKLKLTDGGWVLKAIEKRFEAHKMDVDKKVMIAVLSIGDGVVGKCTKYVDDIADWGNEFYHTKVEWKRFTNDIYPWGILFFKWQVTYGAISSSGLKNNKHSDYDKR